jgi:hypothetical protein
MTSGPLVHIGSRPELAAKVRHAIAKLATKNKRARAKGIIRLRRRAWLAGLPAVERWQIGAPV